MKAPVNGMPGMNRTRSTNHTTRPLNRSEANSFCWLLVEHLVKSTYEGRQGGQERRRGRELTASVVGGGRWIVMGDLMESRWS